ncbi:MAG: hypothetical protein KY468_20865 [Armatimonadetes bacterium]|nr:hypothetical protein [Armatimonadota bacterium]
MTANAPFVPLTVEAVKTGDRAVIQRFIETNYGKERMPAAVRADIVRDGFSGFGARHPVRLVRSGEWETTVLGESALEVYPKTGHILVVLSNYDPSAGT